MNEISRVGNEIARYFDPSGIMAGDGDRIGLTLISNHDVSFHAWTRIGAVDCESLLEAETEFVRWIDNLRNGGEAGRRREGRHNLWLGEIEGNGLLVCDRHNRIWPYSPEDWKKDDIKWSVYAQRKIVDGVTLSGQVARDHARAWAYPTGKTYWRTIRDKDHLHRMLRLTANI